MQTESPSIPWRKSARSGINNGCVELAKFSSGIGVRDSKNISGGPELRFSLRQWESFVSEIRKDA